MDFWITGFAQRGLLEAEVARGIGALAKSASDLSGSKKLRSRRRQSALTEINPGSARGVALGLPTHGQKLAPTDVGGYAVPRSEPERLDSRTARAICRKFVWSPGFSRRDARHWNISERPHACLSQQIKPAEAGTSKKHDLQDFDDATLEETSFLGNERTRACVLAPHNPLIHQSNKSSHPPSMRTPSIHQSNNPVIHFP
jgi:hypothetical protein